VDVSLRHQAILMAVRRHGGVRAADMAVKLGVSGITVRRDLAELEAQGELRRVYGGAVLPDYRPDPGADAAPARVTGRPVTIGMVIPTTTRYFREILEGAKQAARVRGVKLVVEVTDYNLEHDRTHVQRLLDAKVDGLLLTPDQVLTKVTPTMDWIAELPIPVLFVERSHEPAALLHPVEYVSSDHEHGTIQAIRHLAELGHRAIALVTSQSATAYWITRGYDAAVAALGLATDMPRHEHLSHEEIHNSLDDILDGVERAGVTAVLAHSDSTAVEILHRARNRGLVVPDDLAIVAYDDEYAALADLPLTAVAPLRADVGRLAVDFLLRKVHGGRSRRAELHIQLLPRVIVRASTGPHKPSTG